jgi:hypothetical protein
MLDRYTAQGLLDGMAALALGASVTRLARQGSASPLRARLGFAIGGLCLFFVTRSIFEIVNWSALRVAVLLIVCSLPLAALILAEGVLRRHAPALIKALVAIGGGVMAVAIAVSKGAEPASSVGLGGYVLASLGAATGLLLLRDRKSLSPQENLSVDTLLVVAVLLGLLTVSDFLPPAPIGLSGVGAAVLAYVLEEASPNSRSDSARVASELGVMVFLAAIVALALAGPLAIAQPAPTFRLAALLLALLLAAGTVMGALRQRGGRTLLDFNAAMARADTASLEGFMQTMGDQPLLSGLRLVEGSALADYDAEHLAAAMAARPIWTRDGVARGDATVPTSGKEALADLMARMEATHAMMISSAPLRIALLTLPDLSLAGEMEIDLALFRKLAAIAAGNRLS